MDERPLPDKPVTTFSGLSVGERHVLERKTYGMYRSGAVALCGAKSLFPSFSSQQPPTCEKCKQLLLEAQYGNS